MKAVVIHAPHDLRIEEIDAAPAAGAGEVKVAIARGGICGSDLHYYHDGGFGTVRIKQPMALGHEVSGVVTELGAGVTGLAVGDKVAVNPSRPCGECEFCKKDMRHECLDMRFNGSAMRMPHEQGLFRAEVTVPAELAVRVSPETDLGLAALSEPFSVCLHAVNQAGALLGRRVLISGSGPIGCLCVAAAKLAGAAEIIVTDITPAPLKIAAAMGADRCIDLSAEPEALDALRQNKGRIDCVFECSGAAPALKTACEVVRPGGQIVTVGLGSEPVLPLSLVVTKEIRLAGSFRFDHEFAVAADLIDRGRVDLAPVLTGDFPMEDAVAAFDFASDKAKAMKVQLRFEQG
ncbi:L-idonate 5-dehydrogenase [Tropicimonas sp. IMCC6043]|uniref:L-idonate 5-dehydrogenase n=1 Tax=Tropicimonas sp. IMCC6043 TaxID=2510645 RepID=UPI00101C4570|nr:L-idonate 5-dehydrogenase [Tropicimonas sp. IMCC6043]RYH12305.1 L-idonate 5-dehydrogenase [Tropicimonas sp. IMCC6043]